MDFTTELISFPSEVHKIIYTSTREIIPFNISSIDIKEQLLLESCKQFYDFIMEMLSDMYDNPLEYNMPVHKLEDFLGDKKVNGMKQKFPSKTKTLISITRNAVFRYFEVLAIIGYYGNLSEEGLVLPKEAFPILEKIANTSTSPVSFNNRMKSLERIGLTQKEETFISLKYPKMFMAMSLLGKKTKGKTSGFPGYLFSKLDFRNILKDYKPVYTDYFIPLLSSNKQTADRIHQIAKAFGCKEMITTFLKVDYKYKGSQVMVIDTSDNTLTIKITECYSWDDRTYIDNYLENSEKAFQKYALKHLNRCTACSTTHLGQFITILGTRCRVCGGGMIGFNWTNPSEEDIMYIEKFISLRCKYLDN